MVLRDLGGRCHYYYSYLRELAVSNMVDHLHRVSQTRADSVAPNGEFLAQWRRILTINRARSHFFEPGRFFYFFIFYFYSKSFSSKCTITMSSVPRIEIFFSLTVLIFIIVRASPRPVLPGLPPLPPHPLLLYFFKNTLIMSSVPHNYIRYVIDSIRT